MSGTHECAVPYPRLGVSWYIVGTLSLAAVVSYIDRSILGMFVEPIRRDLAIGDVEISLLQGLSFAICYSVAAIPLARLADTRNRIRLVVCGMVLWSAMTAACGMAATFTELFIARMGVGIGEAVLIPATVSLLPDLFPRRYLGRANAVFTIGAGAGTGLALVLGGWLIGVVAPLDLGALGHRLDRPWRVIFLIVGLPGIFIAALLLLTVREPPRRDGEPPARSMDWDALKAFSREHRRALVPMLIGFLCASTAFSGWLAWLPTYLVRAFGMSLSDVGPQLGALVLVFGLSGNLAGGLLVDHLFSRGLLDAPLRLAACASVLMAGCAAAATLMPTSSAAMAMIAPLFFLGTCLTVLPPVSFQMMAPAPIRSQVFAIFQCLVICVSMGLGPTLVAALNEWIAMGQGDLRLALRLNTAGLTLVSGVVLLAGSGAYRRSLAGRLTATT